MRRRAGNTFYALYRLWIAFTVTTCDLVKSMRNLRKPDNEPGSTKSWECKKVLLRPLEIVCQFTGLPAFKNSLAAKDLYRTRSHYDLNEIDRYSTNGKESSHYGIGGSSYPLDARWNSTLIRRISLILNQGTNETIEQATVKARPKRQLVGSKYIGKGEHTTHSDLPDFHPTLPDERVPQMQRKSWTHPVAEKDPSLFPVYNNGTFSTLQYLPTSTYAHYHGFSLPTSKSLEQMETHFNTSSHAEDLSEEDEIASGFQQRDPDEKTNNNTLLKDFSPEQLEQHSRIYDDKLETHNQLGWIKTAAMHAQQETEIFNKLGNNKSVVYLAESDANVLGKKHGTHISSVGDNTNDKTKTPITLSQPKQQDAMLHNVHILTTHGYYDFSNEEKATTNGIPYTSQTSVAALETFAGNVSTRESYYDSKESENSRKLAKKGIPESFQERKYQTSNNINSEGSRLSQHEQSILTFTLTHSTTPATTESSTENTTALSKVTDEDLPNKKGLIYQFKLKYPVKLWKTLGMLEDKYLESINEHWMEYDPPSPILHIGFAVLYGIFMVVGCGGNFLVIYMFARCRSLRTPPNYLILNLSISDFLMLAKTPIYIINSFYYGPALGQWGCSIYGFIGGLTGTASIMTLASIALDRYYAIVYPLNPFKRTTSRRAVLMILCVWTYAAVFSSLPLFGVNNYTSEGFLTSCSFDCLSENLRDRIFVFVFFLAAWLVPLLVILFSYLNIFRMVQAAEQMETFNVGNAKSTAGESFKFKKTDSGKHRSEVKIAWLAGSLVAMWNLAWLPYSLIALLGIMGWKSVLTPLVSALPAVFCKTSSCVNPFIYSMNHPKFQRELRSCFPWCFRTRNRRKDAREESFYSTVTYRGNENSNDCINQSFRTTSRNVNTGSVRAPTCNLNQGVTRDPQVKSSLACTQIGVHKSKPVILPETHMFDVDLHCELQNELKESTSVKDLGESIISGY